MSDPPNGLSLQRCKPCEGGVPPLEREVAEELMQALDSGWRFSTDGKWIERHFEFPNFDSTTGFTNAVAWIANTEDHHPDMEVSYGFCHVKYTTHAIEGLSENDFICAAKIDRLVA